MEGWERKRVNNTGVPYYVNRELDLTQWDHPHLVKLQKQFCDASSIKYTAYRTATKLRAIQRTLGFDGVSLATVVSVLERHGLRPGEGEQHLNIDKIEALIADVFYITKRQCRGSGPVISELATELTLNLLLDIFDPKKTGDIRVLCCQALLVTLSNGKLQEKFKYLFRQMANHNNCLSRKSLAVLLHCLCRIPEWLEEGRAFGKELVAGAVESCFSKYPGPFGVVEELFMEWMLQDPQTLVWWSTLYRMQVAEAVVHPGRCGICKKTPLNGLRYQCLMCWRLDICQNCFFFGMSGRHHSNRHPLQEYCRQATGKERTRAFLQTIKNRFLPNQNDHNRYLPILPSSAIDQELSSVLEIADEVTPLPPCPSDDSQVELASRTLIIDNEEGSSRLRSILGHLEEENRCLANEVERLQSDTAPAQNKVLEKCNLQLDIQLGRLKRLLNNYLPKNSENKDEINLNYMKPQMESTPSLVPQMLQSVRLPYLSPIPVEKEKPSIVIEKQNSVKNEFEESGVSSTINQSSISNVSFQDLTNYEQGSSSFSDYNDLSSHESTASKGVLHPELDILLRKLENLVPNLNSEPQLKCLADQLEQLVENTDL